MSSTEHILEAIRELHAPDGTETALRCEGCDFQGWESEPPEWPCRTAELVYTADEIAEIRSASWSAWVRAATRRRSLATGWTFLDDMYADIARRMRRSPLAQLAGGR